MEVARTFRLGRPDPNPLRLRRGSEPDPDGLRQVVLRHDPSDEGRSEVLPSGAGVGVQDSSTGPSPPDVPRGVQGPGLRRPPGGPHPAYPLLRTGVPSSDPTDG